MPNWVFNHLTIEGNELDIKRVKQQVGQPFTREYSDFTTNSEGKLERTATTITFDNPIFSFWNIKKPTDLNAYLYEESSGIPADGGDWFTGNGWYDWNVRNWGTKWDVAVENSDQYPETKILDETDRRIQYKFDTAWSPPIPAIAELSKKHSRVVFTLDYEEETSWGGQMVFRNGIMEQTSEYEFRCECGEEWKEEPELGVDGQCPECAKEEANV